MQRSWEALVRGFVRGVIGGLVLGVGVGATVVTTAAEGTPGVQPGASAAAPCTSASYAISVSATQVTVPWSITISGQVDFTTDAATANLTLPSSFPSFLTGTTLQVVLVGGTVYVSVPPALAGYVGGASWVSIALPSSVNSVVDNLLGHLATWCGNPQSIVGALSAPRSAPTSLKTSTIGGVVVTGTHINAKSKTVTKTLGLTRTLTSGLPSTMTKGTSRRNGRMVPVNWWVNAQGQLAQLSINVQQPIDVSITIDVTNIDQPVSITAPVGAVPIPVSVLGFLGPSGHSSPSR